MGKGIIKSGGDDGLYNVELALHRDRVDDTIKIIDAQIETLTTKINAMEEGDEKELEKLRRSSYQKRKDYLNDNMSEDPTVSAWCGDLTEDLGGNVGTIEIPGERGIVQIQPGYEGGAAYNITRDGQLQPAAASTPAGTFYNLAMLPGWQKWMPTYRHGVISNIDTDNDTCDVALDAATSSQQGLTVNQAGSLTGIPIEYMSCNSIAFENGDSVLVKFEGQEWSGAKVVGFKEEPKSCSFSFRITRDDDTVMDHTLMADGLGWIYIYEGSKIVGLVYPYDPDYPEYWTHEVDAEKGIDVWKYYNDSNPDYIYEWSYNVKTQIWTVPFLAFEEHGTGRIFRVNFRCGDSITAQYKVPADPLIPEYVYKTADLAKDEDKISTSFYEVAIPLYEVRGSLNSVWYTEPPEVPPVDGWWPETGCWNSGGETNCSLHRVLTVRSSIHYKVRFRAYNDVYAGYYGNYKTGCYMMYCQWCRDNAWEHWYCKKINDYLAVTSSNGDLSSNVKTNPIDSEQIITPAEYTVEEGVYTMDFNCIAPDPWEMQTICAEEEMGDSFTVFPLPLMFFNYNGGQTPSPHLI
jgi:hypothetical protein